MRLAPPQQAVAPFDERLQIPEPSDPDYRAAIEVLRKRVEAMPENTQAQKEDKLALRKYLETKLMDVEFARIAEMDEIEYRSRLEVIKKDIERLPENTAARKRDKRELQQEFERRRVDLDLWRIGHKKTDAAAAPKAVH